VFLSNDDSWRFIAETVQAITFAARPAGANKKPSDPSMLNHNLFSGPDRPVARNIP